MEPQCKVVISGDRNWSGSDLEAKMEWLFRQLPQSSLIIHGACKGVDMTADKVSKKLGYKVESVPADWTKYGRAAGPIRNKEMLEMGANVVFAFHQNIAKSKGTKNMIEQAKKQGVPVYLIN